MSCVYVIRNHENAYLNRKSEWVSGIDNSVLFVSPHRDVALNQLIEANAHEIEARLVLVECEVDDKKLPVVEVCPRALHAEKVRLQKQALLESEAANSEMEEDNNQAETGSRMEVALKETPA